MKKILFSTTLLFLVSCSSNDGNLGNDVEGNGGSGIVTDNSGGSSSCIKPNELRVQQTTSNSTVITWAEVNGSQLYNIEYGARGFTLGSGTRISASSSGKEISGLNSATEYDFYIRANCGGSTYSVWAGPHSFVTN